MQENRLFGMANWVFSLTFFIGILVSDMG